MTYITCPDCGHSYCVTCELACPLCGYVPNSEVKNHA